MSQRNSLSLSLARHTSINLISQAIPPIVAIVAIPFTVKGLGTEQFGILSILWVFIGYSSFLELGLSRALTKYVAEYVERHEEEKIANAVWATLFVQLVLGTATGITLVALSPFLINWLSIPQTLINEARLSFYLIGLLPPLIFSSASLSGLLMARQRFGLVSAVQVSSSTLNYAMIGVGAYSLSLKLSTIVMLIVVVKVLTFLSLLQLSRSVYPVLKQPLLIKLKAIRPLLNFGGWVSATNILGQILSSADRFFISTSMSISWVTHYAVPFDALSRLWILPTSLVTTLFPTLTSLMASPRRDERMVGQIYVRSIKYMLLTIVPLAILVAVFAGDLLSLWMGEEFAQKSSRTFQILAIGVPLASLVWIPYTLLQSVGRPDLPAKFLFLESLVYFVLLWVMIRSMGIEGAALAWTIRAGLDIVLQFSAVSRLELVSVNALGETGFIKTLFLISLLVGAVFFLSLLGGPLLARVAWAVTLSVLFAIGSWRYVLDSLDKKPISMALGKLFSSSQANAR